MNISQKSKAQVQTTFAAVAVCALMIGLASTLCSAAPPVDAQPAQTNSVTLNVNAKTPDMDTNNIELKRHLTGAELYSMNCNRCHQERYPTERTGAQWKTIMLHMQVRANIPVSQAKLILQYLQDNSGR
jgi:cytochrome c5